MTRGHRLTIDPIACTGAGVCAELLPELIDLDDWGYPMFRGAAVVPERLVGHARRAVDVCPVVALRLHSVASPSSPPVAVRSAVGRSS